MRYGAVLEDSRDVVADSVSGKEVTLRPRGRPTVDVMRERYFVRDRMASCRWAGEGIFGAPDVERCMSSFRLRRERCIDAMSRMMLRRMAPHDP